MCKYTDKYKLKKCRMHGQTNCGQRPTPITLEYHISHVHVEYSFFFCCRDFMSARCHCTVHGIRATPAAHSIHDMKLFVEARKMSRRIDIGCAKEFNSRLHIRTLGSFISRRFWEFSLHRKTFRVTATKMCTN